MSTVEFTPRSVLRHRPIAPTTQMHRATDQARASRTMPVLDEVDQRTKTSQEALGKRMAAQERVSSRGKKSVKKEHMHSSNVALTVMLAMCATVVLIGLAQVVMGWVTVTLDDLHYGRPRTFQMSAFVGHEQDSGQASHFIALNNQGRIEVIEFPGNDVAHARVFLGPQLTGAQADLVPITIHFSDPLHTHHPDMIVQFQQTTLVFRNSQGTFQQLNN